MCRCTNWEILLDKCFPGSIGTRSLILFFRSKHRIPCRETYRLLFQDFLYFGSREFCFYDKTEHVFVEPFVCHDEMSLITTGGAPTILYHPFHGFSVLIEIDCHQRHGMARAACKSLDALFLVHAERGAHQRLVVIVIHIEQAALRMEEFAHIA